MPQEKKPRFTLGSADDLFTTQEMRDDAKLARIHEIPLDEIDELKHIDFVAMQRVLVAYT